MQTFLNLVVGAVLNWLKDLLVSLWQMVVKRKRIDDEAQDAAEEMKKAVTGDEIDKATDDTLSKL